MPITTIQINITENFATAWFYIARKLLILRVNNLKGKAVLWTKDVDVKIIFKYYLKYVLKPLLGCFSWCKCKHNFDSSLKPFSKVFIISP